MNAATLAAPRLTGTTTDAPVVGLDAPDAVRGYGLERPVLRDVVVSLRRARPEDCEDVWDEVVAQAQAQFGRALPRVDDVVTVLREHPVPVVALVGESLSVRLRTYDALAARLGVA